MHSDKAMHALLRCASIFAYVLAALCDTHDEQDRKCKPEHPEPRSRTKITPSMLLARTLPRLKVRSRIFAVPASIHSVFIR